MNHPFLLRNASVTAALLLSMLGARAQTAPLASGGKDFWLGFMQNAYGAQALRLTIASPSGATGTVSMPLGGWSTGFSVGPNGQTTLIVPATAEHVGSEVVANKGIRVQSDNNITVTATSYQSFTADAAQVLPLRSLGTSYRAQAYRGLPGFADFYKSELLIVATEDGTQVKIVPSVNTSGGHPAGIPFTVNLDQGQTYQVQSAMAALDLTGTLVEATTSSGACRPFAVFSGSMCANVPVGCPACDHIYEQMVPMDQWGTLFHTARALNVATCTIRVVAAQNGTQVAVDGGAPVPLNAGQSLELNGVTSPLCISATQPVSVAQHFEGFNCAGQGDPAMLELLPDERVSTSALWSTMISGQIGSHSVSVIMPTANTGQLTIDGAPVNQALFVPYTGCSGWSYAAFPVASGTHRIAATGGFLAYASGTGTGESYAFIVGSVFFPDDPPQQIICSSGPVTLTAPQPIVNAEWTTASDPGTLLGTGPSLTFTPTANDTYILDGQTTNGLCPLHFEWEVGLPPPSVNVTANGLASAQVCQNAAVQLNVLPVPDPDSFDLAWTPSSTMNDATVPDPVAYPATDTWFKLLVTSPVGCGSVIDSVFVDVLPHDVEAIVAVALDDTVCPGQSTTLQARAERIVASDNFNDAPSAIWASISGGSASALCGAITGNALRFDGAGTRSATTTPFNMVNGAALHFALRIANGTAPCDDPEPGDDILVQHSPDGVTWTTIATLLESAYPAWTTVDLPLPTGLSSTTRFRWKQAANSGAGTDNWAIDDVRITRYDNTGLVFAWSPATGLSAPNSASTSASPAGPTTWTVTAQTLSGCSFTDQVTIEVQPAFTLTATADTTICTPGSPVQLQAVASQNSGITWAWSPATWLTNTTTAAPLATAGTTTTWTVTATGPGGCTAQEQVSITVGQLGAMNVTTSDASLCQGAQCWLNAAFTAGSPCTVTWTPDNGSLNSLTGAWVSASPTAPTTYIATVTEDLSGCSVQDSVHIHVSTAYTADAGQDTSLCSTTGHQLNVVHNVPLATISWSNPSLVDDAALNSPTVLFDTTATYQVTVTDTAGCFVTDLVTVSDAFDELITPEDVSACAGTPVLLDAGFPGSSYAWSTNAATQSISVDTAGSYHCTITNPQGCQASRTFNVVFNAMPVVDLGPDLSICGNYAQTLDAGNPGNAFSWSTGANDQQITVTQDGTYSVSVTTPFNCTAADEVNIAFHALPTDELADATVCAGTPVSLNAGNPGASYQWNNGATTQSIVPDSSGTYSVTIITPEQCAATYVAIVAILPVVNIDLGPDTTLCSGQVLVLDAGTSGLNYTWNTGATTQTIQATTSGTYSVSASNGACAGQDAISLTFDPSPTDPLQDTIACAGGTITLDAGNPGCTWLWNTGATTPTIDVVSSGTYSVTVTNAMNCSGHFDAEVTFADPPVVDLGPDTVLCEGDVLTLDAGNPGATYQWSNGQDTRTINVTSGGIYSVVVNNGLCTGTDGISTTFNQRPDRLGTHQFFTCLDKEPHYVVISAGNNGSSYEWSTGASSQVILAGAYGWYYVDITNSLDCSVRDSAVVTEFCDPSLYVPNSFTPNGDGVNDIWHADGNNIGYFNLNVFDRGGQVIFHSENFTYGWDGKIDGEDAPPGVYVWRMEYRFVKDTEGKEGMIHSQLGHVTLLR